MLPAVQNPEIWILSYFCVMSAVSCIQFGWDKSQAKHGGWRVPESTLLTVAFLGGAMGAVSGRALFRHKTRKEPFRTKLNAMLVQNLVMFCLLMIPGTRLVLIEFVQEFIWLVGSSPN